MESSLQHQEIHRLCRCWLKKLCLLPGQDQFLCSYHLQRRTSLRYLGKPRLHHLGYDYITTMRYWHSFAQYLEITTNTNWCKFQSCLHLMHWCYSDCSCECLQNRLSHSIVNSSSCSPRPIFVKSVCNDYSNQQLLAETLRALHLESRAIDSHYREEKSLGLGLSYCCMYCKRTNVDRQCHYQRERNCPTWLYLHF